MIYVKLVGHDFQNGIEDTLRMFFEGEVIISTDKEPPEDFRGIFLCSTIISEGVKQSLLTRLVHEEHIAAQSTNALTDGLVHEAQHNIKARQKLKREIMRQTYLVLSQYTCRNFPWGMLTGIRPSKIVHELLDEGMDICGIKDKLTGYYLVSGDKADLLYNVALAERKASEDTAPDMVGVYIGIPFCPTRCLYCSFTSNPVEKYKNKVGDYIAALKYEIMQTSEIIRSKGYRIQSVYIGGGTPTALDSNYLQELLEYVEASLDLNSLKEYTLEAGRPDSIDQRKLEIIKRSKVDRISINPQTMNDNTLRIIGRNHTADDIICAFKLAREIGFNNINMDVIAGLPGEDLDMFKRTLSQIEALSPENVTVHTMSVKRASKLNEQKDKYDFTEGQKVMEMTAEAQKYVSVMGLYPYYLYRQKNMLGNLENIGYSKPGFESIFNIHTMTEKQSIIAMGAGGITKVVFPQENRIERTFNVKSVEEYIARVGEMVQRKSDLMLNNGVVAK